MKVLYVEDEKFLADAVKHNLGKEGFDVDLAYDGEEGMEKAVSAIYDAVILDVMLPKYSGLEILADMRKRKVQTPVIMLSALSEVEDKIRGLEVGADDYLAKPFKTAELAARLRALMRRPAKIQERCLKFGDLTYDLDEKTLNGVSLTQKEAGIMAELMRTPEKLLPKEFLLNKVWSDEAFEDNYIEVYVSRLRKTMRKLKCSVSIVSVRGMGYKIVRNDV